MDVDISYDSRAHRDPRRRIPGAMIPHRGHRIRKLRRCDRNQNPWHPLALRPRAATPQAQPRAFSPAGLRGVLRSSRGRRFRRLLRPLTQLVASFCPVLASLRCPTNSPSVRPNRNHNLPLEAASARPENGRLPTSSIRLRPRRRRGSFASLSMSPSGLELRCFSGRLWRSCLWASPSSKIFLSPLPPDVTLLSSRPDLNLAGSRGM